MVRPLLFLADMKSVIAALLVATVSASSGCGWILADLCGQPGSCEPTQSIGTSHDDSDTNADLALAGVAIATAVIVALIVKGSHSHEPARVGPSIAPQRVAVIAPVPSGSDREQLLQRMYVQGYLSASTGKCEATIAIGNRLAELSPSYHDRYADDPTIATCLRR